MSDNYKQATPDESILRAEVVAACSEARRLFPDEAFVQVFLIAQFLGNERSFAENKRLLENLLRRPIGLRKPYTQTEFLAHIAQAARTEASRQFGNAIVLPIPPRTRH